MRCVYLIRNRLDGKVYVGQSGNPSLRRTRHFYLARKGSPQYLYRAIRDHGEENFVFEIIEECADDLINERERFWVSFYDSFNPKKGYNLTSGGDHYEHSESTKQKIACSVRKTMSEESRRIRSEANRGKIKSFEHRQKIAQSLKGIQRSDETRRKMSKSQKTRHSPVVE